MEKPWAKAVLELVKEERTALKTGLTLDQVRDRLKEHGANSLDYEKPISSWIILRRQFINIFVLILFIASIIALYSEGIDQAIVLWVIIILNVALGFLQENKAEKTLQALKDSITSQAIVIRDGKHYKINSEEIVPGDLVVLESGDQVPADIRLTEVHNLEVNQAALTGESTPVKKITSVLADHLNALEADNLVFSGTHIVAGRGRGLVFATGKDCQFGKIADLVNKKRNETPLEKRLRFLGQYLTVVSIVLATLLFVLGLSRDWPIFKLLTYSMAILVAIVPESLPTTITLALAIGVVRMARKKAIVRRLSSVETLGLVNVIATDKTGTLTKNQLEVAEVVLPGPVKNRCLWFNLTGDQLLSATNEEMIKEFLKTSVLCTDVVTSKRDSIGDPTEVGIVKAAEVFGVNVELEKRNSRRLSEIPFDSENGYMATFHRHRGKSFLVAKGSYEKISYFSDLDREERKTFLQAESMLANQGMRVIAVAEKKASQMEESSLRRLKFLGLIGLVDLPSESAIAGIRKSLEAGIQPVMITGDNALTARYVAAAVGMDVRPEEILDGEQVEEFTGRGLRAAIRKIKIFARVSPEHKIKIVEAMKKAGSVVAVTGDGVNDGPALRAADVGVAMGRGGTAVAQEAADIVLLDNNYGTIVEAISLGRAIYDNIQKATAYLLSGSFVELSIVAFAFIANLPVPITAVQILWMNLVTDALPAMAFAFEPPENDVLSRGPGDNRKSATKHLLLYSGALVVVSLPAVIFTFLYYLNFHPEVVSSAVMNMMIFVSWAFAVSVHTLKPFWRNIRATFSNAYLWGAIGVAIVLQVIMTQTKIGGFLGLKPLALRDYLFILAWALVTFLIAEVAKGFFYGRGAKKNRD